MEILLPVAFACGILTSASAVPLASGISFGDSDSFDSFILMPGVSLRRVFKENSAAIVKPTEPPVLFGITEPHESPAPIIFGNRKNVVPDSFGNRKNVVSDSKEIKKPFSVSNANRFDFFPNEKPTLFNFPSAGVKPNILSVDIAAPTKNVTVAANGTTAAANTTANTLANNITAVPATIATNATLTNTSLETKPVKPVPLPALSSNLTDNSSSSFLFRGTINVNMTRKPSVSNSTTLDNKPKCELSDGSIEFNGTCTRFLARNGCPAGQWFIKTNNELGGGCFQRPCPVGQLFFKGKCINVTDETVCKDGQMLYVDFSGQVHCDCQPSFIYDPWSGNCFAQGDQGYCNFGEQLVLEDGVVRCERNPCIMNGFVYHNATGWCYRKRYRGFCDDALLIVHKNNRTAECSAIAAHSIFDLPTMKSCDGGTVRDYAGVCREEFRVPVISTFPVMYGDCPFGFIKDSQGTCRKTHKLFG